MKNYELTYLISPELSEEELKSFQDKIISLIQNEGGNLIEFNSPIKKTLSYPIKKRPETFLATINFYLPKERLSDLEKKLQQESKIFRYLILTKKMEKRVVSPIKPRAVKPKPKPKAELKEIEKKLEEILGEA